MDIVTSLLSHRFSASQKGRAIQKQREGPKMGRYATRGSDVPRPKWEYAVPIGDAKTYRILLLAMHYQEVHAPKAFEEYAEPDTMRIQNMMNMLRVKTFSFARNRNEGKGYAEQNFNSRINLSGFDLKPNIIALDWYWMQRGYFANNRGESYGMNWFTKNDGVGKIFEALQGGVDVFLMPNDRFGAVEEMYDAYKASGTHPEYGVWEMSMEEAEEMHPLVVATKGFEALEDRNEDIMRGRDYGAQLRYLSTGRTKFYCVWNKHIGDESSVRRYLEDVCAKWATINSDPM